MYKVWYTDTVQQLHLNILTRTIKNIKDRARAAIEIATRFINQAGERCTTYIMINTKFLIELKTSDWGQGKALKKLFLTFGPSRQR